MFKVRENDFEEYEVYSDLTHTIAVVMWNKSNALLCADLLNSDMFSDGDYIKSPDFDKFLIENKS